MPRLIPFKYTIIDRAFCVFEQTIVIDNSKVVVIGERDDWMIFDDHKKGFLVTKAFMVNYLGVEYGTEDISKASLFNYVGCNDPIDQFQIFEPIFENEFE